MFGMGLDIGIDLGTATVLVYIKGKGIVLTEPSVVAIERESKKVLAVGEDARKMIGRTPGNIIAIRPIREGVISDYEITEKMLKYFISKACGSRSFIRPRVMIAIPAKVTGVERRAVIEAAQQAGARKVYLIEQPIAAAIGAGMDISKPSGNMVVDIGGGTTDIAVISLGGSVVSASLKVAGDNFDEAIIQYMKKVHKLMIGERTAEEVKKTIGYAHPKNPPATMEIRGRSLVTGLPQNITIDSSETLEALKEPVSQIVEAVHNVLEKTPPELAADISTKGIIMTGGGSLLNGLDKLMEDILKIPVFIAENPISCVALGTGKALESLDNINRNRVGTNVIITGEEV
ncbi:MAG: rod shape-determining protein [Thermoanaerobacteraceae bacterium]|nr:rod shape-determining protein [Thermoanaerobacteraceae bacterium]